MFDSKATQPSGSQTLRKVSSLVINSTASSLKTKLNPQNSFDEIVPDSEEERLSVRHLVAGKENALEIVDISSDEDESFKHRTLKTQPDDPFLDDFAIPGAFPDEPIESKSSLSSEDAVSWTPRTPRAISNPQREPRQRAEPMYLDPNVIELTDSSDSSAEPKKILTKSKAKKKAVELPKEKANEFIQPLYWSDDENEDGALLTLNELKRARKPIRLMPAPTSPGVVPSTPKKRHVLRIVESDILSPQPSTPSSAGKSKKLPKPPRSSKKSQAEAEQRRRVAYAEEFFVELNSDVFNDALPKDTSLKWNKRLLTTAGKAHWHRNRVGVDETKIELADKILDTDERIRNTLSHEMCHLATWVIDGNPREGHGALFHKWAAKVMRKKPEVEITTKHSYEIAYKYSWECVSCARVYGRFSKSINTARDGCGACQGGILRPLFAVREPKGPKNTSLLAAGKTQDSPRPISRPRPSVLITKEDDSGSDNGCYCSDSDIEIINLTMSQVTLSETL